MLSIHSNCFAVILGWVVVISGIILQNLIADLTLVFGNRSLAQWLWTSTFTFQQPHNQWSYLTSKRTQISSPSEQTKILKNSIVCFMISVHRNCTTQLKHRTKQLLLQKVILLGKRGKVDRVDRVDRRSLKSKWVDEVAKSRVDRSSRWVNGLDWSIMTTRSISGSN